MAPVRRPGGGGRGCATCQEAPPTHPAIPGNMTFMMICCERLRRDVCGRNDPWTHVPRPSRSNHPSCRATRRLCCTNQHCCMRLACDFSVCCVQHRPNCPRARCRRGAGSSDTPLSHPTLTPPPRLPRPPLRPHALLSHMYQLIPRHPVKPRALPRTKSTDPLGGADRGFTPPRLPPPLPPATRCRRPPACCGGAQRRTPAVPAWRWGWGVAAQLAAHRHGGDPRRQGRSTHDRTRTHARLHPPTRAHPLPQRRPHTHTSRQ